MIVDPCEVRSAPRISHRRTRGVGHGRRTLPLRIHTALAARIRHRLRDVTENGTKRRRSSCVETNALCRDVLIEGCPTAPRQPKGVVLHKFRGAHQPPLLGIPGGEYDRPFRSMACLHGVSHCTRRLQHAHATADIVGCAGTPTVSVATHHHHFTRILPPPPPPHP